MKRFLGILTSMVMLFSVCAVNASAAEAVSDKDIAFYIQVDGVELDADGKVSPQPKSSFSAQVASGELKENKESSYTITVRKDNGDREIREQLVSVPDENEIFDKIVDEFIAKDAIIKDNTGSVVKWDKFNANNYRIHWYVLKYEKADGWHVDGIIVDRDTDDVVSIIEPGDIEDKPEASCVKYDVRAGKFTPGIMDINENRPHSDLAGDNDNLILQGFEDVWYTVLDKDTFKPNTREIPQRLMEAAEAVSDLAGARLGELDPVLHREYGRIDSQAWKREYVDRSGKSTLSITPFINSELLSLGIDHNDYIWLAVGDRAGNVQYVYVMDREMAGITENLFDNE